MGTETFVEAAGCPIVLAHLEVAEPGSLASEGLEHAPQQPGPEPTPSQIRAYCDAKQLGLGAEDGHHVPGHPDLLRLGAQSPCELGQRVAPLGPARGEVEAQPFAVRSHDERPSLGGEAHLLQVGLEMAQDDINNRWHLYEQLAEVDRILADEEEEVEA